MVQYKEFIIIPYKKRSTAILMVHLLGQCDTRNNTISLMMVSSFPAGSITITRNKKPSKQICTIKVIRLLNYIRVERRASNGWG